MAKTSSGPNFVCPYTGKTMELVFDEDLRWRGYYLRNGFDPSLPFLTEAAGIRALSMRKGKPAEKPGPLVCPYNDNPITLVWNRKSGLWEAHGTYFIPSRRWDEKEWLLYAMSFRKGRKPAFGPPKVHKITVTEREEHSDPTAGLGIKDDDVEHGVSLLLGDK